MNWWDMIELIKVHGRVTWGLWCDWAEYLVYAFCLT